LARDPRFRLHAIVDVDKRLGERLMNKFPGAKFYWDWRTFFEKEIEHVDSCSVGVPDHMHAPIAMTALRHDKHLYCQKPLCHDLFETRRLREEADQREVVTQMGIQMHSYPRFQAVPPIVQRGDIGKVHTVHVWSNKMNYAHRAAPPPSPDPVPEKLNWNLWLGTAPYRPYVEDLYHPTHWRQWMDFGTGHLGDMGCHLFDPIFTGLKLTNPRDVRSEGPAPTHGGWPAKQQLHYTFPATEYTDPNGLRVIWRDSGLWPPEEAQQDLGHYDLPRNGSLWLGAKGTMVVPLRSQPRLFPRKQFRDYAYPTPENPDHWQQYMNAVFGEGETRTPFSYGGRVTEAVLVGTVAVRFRGQTLRWDPSSLRFTNHSAANAFIRRTYRNGWAVPGLSD
jgi:hypothetical protein